MTIEFGIFNDEGKVVGGFFSKREAEEELTSSEEYEDCYVAKVCRDHEDYEAEFCEMCLNEEE